MLHTTLRRYAALALVATAAACGKDSSTAPKSSNTFKGTITGAVTQTVEGEVVAGQDSGDLGPVYDLAFTNGPVTDGDLAFVFGRLGQTMAPGSYSVADIVSADANGKVAYPADRFFGFYLSDVVGSNFDTLLFGTTSGTVVIDGVSATRVSGHFDVQMVSDTTGVGGTPQHIRVQGSFDGPNESLDQLGSSSRSVPVARLNRATTRPLEVQVVR